MHRSDTRFEIARATRKPLLAALALAALAAAPAHAVTVLDTFGPGGTAPGNNWSLYRAAANDFQSLAVSFTLSSPMRIDSIVSSIDGTGSYALKLVADLASMPIGSVQYSTTISNPVANTPLNGLNWSLSPGRYWLTGEAAAGSTALWPGGGSSASAVWSFLAPSLPGWQPIYDGDAPAVRILASAIPEPGAFLLALGGLALVGWRSARRPA